MMSEEKVKSMVFSCEALKDKSRWFKYGYAEYVHCYENDGLCMDSIPDYVNPAADDEEFGNGYMFASRDYDYSDSVLKGGVVNV